MPVVALGTDIALHGSTSVVVALVLIVALKAAVHHAEVVALRVGEPFGAILLALAVRARSSASIAGSPPRVLATTSMRSRRS